MIKEEFYEAYWKRDGGSPSEHDYSKGARHTKLEKALERIPDGGSVLDAGCGNGAYSAFLHELGYDVSGFDISQTVVNRAAELVPTGIFKTGTLGDGLPFAPEFFDAIWFTEVLEHVFDVHGSLADLNEVLKTNGLLIMTTPFHGVIKNTAIALFGFEKHYNPYISHIRFFTQKSLKLSLENAGFKVLEMGGVGRRWPLWMSHFVVAQKISDPGPAPEIIG